MFASNLISMIDHFVDINLNNISFSLNNHISKNRRAKEMNSGMEDCGRVYDHNDNSNADYIECCRRMVHLDFSETRLSGWGSKHPNSVRGYYCIGHCNKYGGYSNNSNDSSNNNNGYQSFYAELMNAHADSFGLTPCCAPIRFDPLTVTVKHGTLVIRR
ncbi:unnamed protein product [Anisakis simplex]|uniref:TGF_BETA_2 domain-containing protein n=1 Tax=Anisakis simplex TaxID=6269 RepID=A0A0M3K591_ANISI|nr:unnamed protein product [Anisakis simplex]